MKKIIGLLLSFTLLLSLSACGGDTATETQKTYISGDTIETELFRITPKFTGYADILLNFPDEDYMTPTHSEEKAKNNPYAAEDGKVNLYGEIDIEYIGNEKSDVTLTVNISADYDNGYEYSTSDVGHSSDKDEWKYDSTLTFEPLSDDTTRIMRYCIEVPEEVETNQDKPLMVTFTINGEAYTYDFRATEVLGSDYDPRDEFYGEIDAALKEQVRNAITAETIYQYGYYDSTFGEYQINFTDTGVTAVLPINSSYGYQFEGTYEIFSSSILISWSYGDQMHMDYTFDDGVFKIVDFGHDR
ncbi:MAG: hypothetical protein IKW04_05480 [Clostridia bacterium]|nr:hypothetical protein [Clostridia bacterium]